MSNQQENGNRKLKQFHQNYGFDVEKVLKDVRVLEFENPQSKENVLRSLKKGNAQQITVPQDDQQKKYFIAANPQFKTVDLYDEQMKKIKREVLLQPELKTDPRLLKGQPQVAEKEQPQQKQSKKSKLKV